MRKFWIPILLFSGVFLTSSVQPLLTPVDYVNPMIGTDGHGHTFPGATVPFGMVQLSPDTRLEGWDGCSGYHNSDSKIYGFSHTHLSGTGCSDYGDILFQPFTGEIQWKNGDYASSFRKETEIAKAGYYSVVLDKHNIKAELTTTKRVGVHRYSFPANEAARILIDLVHRDKVLDSKIEVTGVDEVVGMRRSQAWASDQQIFFIARFSKPIKAISLSENDTVRPLKKSATGTALKLALEFGNITEPLVIEVAISGVSVEGARKNLMAETKSFDFDAVRKSAFEAWNKELSKITINGGSERNKTIFYTALYHATIQPNLYSDVNGQYRGRDLKVHQGTGDYYTVFSLWDTYRACHPLQTILNQKRTADFINTFILQQQQGGLLPVWELSSNETSCMIGYHAIPVIADAILKNIKGFNYEAAYKAMMASAMQNKTELNLYRKLGFIPAEEEGESVSKTLEYAYDDWCIARVAEKLGKKEDAKVFYTRAQNYKNLYDPETKFFRGKFYNQFVKPFHPAEVNFHYTEANAWQYGFYVPHDINGFIDLLGGREELAQHLDNLFTSESKTLGRDQADITGLIGQYAHGNEPSHHMAYLYSFVQESWKTQQRAHQILSSQYTEKADGLCGNEDCGQMSAWYVLSAMGFYPVTPATDVYVFGTPLFPEVTMHLENGKTFVIRAKNLSDNNFYIKSAKLNGKPYAKSFFTHQDILKGGVLEFEMSDSPEKSFGTGKGNYPVTAITYQKLLPVPSFSSNETNFFQETEISIKHPNQNVVIRYTLNDKPVDTLSPVYNSPIKISKSTTLRAKAFLKGMKPSTEIQSYFRKIPKERRINLISEYAPQYAAGGNNALIDFVRGSLNFHTGTWQGFEGKDFEAIIDLGSVQDVSHFAFSTIQHQGAWIFFPSEVIFYASEDNDNFQNIGSVKNNFPERDDNITKHEFTLNKSTRARYIKVIAKNRGLCPPWHLGAGGKTWIFADEIIID